MLELKDICIVTDGKPVIDKLSMRVEKGETKEVNTDALGAEALVRTVLGLQAPTSGYVTLGGEVIDKVSAPTLRRQMAYVPYNCQVPEMPVSQLAKMLLDLNTNRKVVYSKRILMQHWERLGIDANLYTTSTADLHPADLQRILLTIVALQGKSVMIIDRLPDLAAEAEAERRERTTDFLRSLAQEGTGVMIVVTNS